MDCLPGHPLDGGRLLIEGYPERLSYRPGQTVVFYIKADTSYLLTISRDGGLNRRYWFRSPTTLPPEKRLIPASASEEGCGWEDHISTRFTIPHNWPSGFYLVKMTSVDYPTAPAGETFFVVLPHVRSAASILIKVCTNTYQAYNNFGCGHPEGTTRGSLYDHAQGRVSLKRPMARGFLSPYRPRTGEPISHWSPNAGWNNWERGFVHWAESLGVKLDYVTDWDVHFSPEILTGYRLLLSVGHDEYWSDTMRAAVHQFIDRGGNAAFFSGNVCFRKVDLSNADGGFMRCEPDTLPYHWCTDRAIVSMNTTSGVGFCSGGYARIRQPYTIARPEHPIFQGVFPSHEEPRPYRRGLLTIQAALDPSPARPGAGHTAESWLR